MSDESIEDVAETYARSDRVIKKVEVAIEMYEELKQYEEFTGLSKFELLQAAAILARD